MSNTLLKRQMS